ncbi:MAG: hypothetical protein HN531_06405 [Opitutae bacterium]|jgi:hypothetical protein|nr:hypothetical protein [Opitutae bacterium]
MRIAAGVFLIVAAILNVMGGCSWAGAGACAGCVGEVLEQEQRHQENQWSEADDPVAVNSYADEEGDNETDVNGAETNDTAWKEGATDYDEFEEFEPPSQETIDEWKTSGAGMALYGFAIMILAGVMIGAAICAFKAKKAKFVLITGILSIVAEVMGVLLVYFILPEQEANDILSSAALVFKLPGVLAGIFSIIAVRSFPHPLLSS